jgi:hypothetical protein
MRNLDIAITLLHLITAMLVPDLRGYVRSNQFFLREHLRLLVSSGFKLSKVAQILQL